MMTCPNCTYPAMSEAAERCPSCGWKQGEAPSHKSKNLAPEKLQKLHPINALVANKDKKE